jgi:hypothetical protein
VWRTPTARRSLAVGLLSRSRCGVLVVCTTCDTRVARTQNIGDRTFGFTLQTVSAHKAKLDASDADFNKDADAHVSHIREADKHLQQLHVKVSSRVTGVCSRAHACRTTRTPLSQSPMPTPLAPPSPRRSRIVVPPTTPSSPRRRAGTPRDRSSPRTRARSSPGWPGSTRPCRRLQVRRVCRAYV